MNKNTINFCRKFLKINLLVLFAFFIFTAVQAKTEKEGEEKKFNPGEMILHHIADSHEWEFAEGISIPLPVILWTEKGFDFFMSSEIHHAKKVEEEHEGKKHEFHELEHGGNTYLIAHNGKFALKGGGSVLDLSITKNVVSLFLSMILLLYVFFSVASGYKKNAGKAPKGMQSFFEPIIVFIRDDIAKPNIGHRYEYFLPYLLTVFFFIWFNNLLGLMPSGANVTGNIAVTLSLALFTFFITNLSGKGAYWGHIFNPPGVPMWLKPIMVLIEVIGVFTKPFALTVRLFANITAGHIILLSLICLIFIFKNIWFVVSPLSVIFVVALSILELLVAILQAYIFTLLSAIYIGSAVVEHHHEEHENEHAHH